MRIDAFRAEADLVARRVRVAWTLLPEPGETLADAQAQVLRRKTRDFEFVPQLPDPYVVYDSAAFPPAPAPATTVTDLPTREESIDGELHLVEAISVADDTGGGQWLERLRRTQRTVDDAEGLALRREVEIIDSGPTPLALEPGVACYYQLFSPLFGATDVARSRAVATPAAPHGLNRWMYDQLPAVHRQHDVRLRAPEPGTDFLPESTRGRFGQLRRLLDVYGAVLDGARSSAEALRTLHDIDRVDGRRLPLLAQWLGWRLGDADALPLARNELKATPRLYETVGAVTAARALVTRYTGWTTRVAEFVQHLVRANDAPQPPLRVALEAGGAWHSPVDAAEALGLGIGNRQANGAGVLPAVLTSTQLEPYALYAGAEIGLAVDAGPAWRVRFGRADALDLGAATAAEVAAAIAAASPALQAEAVAGRVVLRSRSTGPDAQLDVSAPANDLLSTDIAGTDRACAVLDAQGRLRVFGSAPVPTPDPQTAADEIGVVGALVVKTWTDGSWRGSQRLEATRALDAPGGHPRVADPAAATLADGRIALAWVDAPHSPAAGLRFTLARARAPEPARLQGRARPPFALAIGQQLTLRAAAGVEMFSVLAADYADPAQASAVEVIAALNGQLVQAVAAVSPDGTLRLTSTASGPQALLAVDLAGSTCARTLGLAHAATQPARGRWDETMDLDPVLALPGPPPQRPVELAALPQGPGLRLAWSGFTAGRWTLQGACWLGPVDLAATAAGLVLQRDDGTPPTVLTLADGLPSSTVRHTAVDADGALWVATAAGTARRRSNGSWAVIDAAAGLPSDDTHQIVQAADGVVWVATAAGLGRISPALVATGLTMLDGLPANDVRALARDLGDGLWIATAGGLAWRDPGGAFVNTGLPALPSLDVRGVAVDALGRVVAATAAGLAQRDDAGAWSRATMPADAGSDLRGVDTTDVMWWVAAAAGVWRRGADGAWRGWRTLHGLPSDDVRRVVAMPDGGAWVATPAGAARIDATGQVRPWTTADGLPSNDVGTATHAWSAWSRLGDAGLAAGDCGDREPMLVREAAGSSLLLWSRWTAGAPGEDRRALRVRRWDPATQTWGAVQAATQPLPAGSADRQPAALALAAGGTRVFFASDRGGNPALWELTLDAALVPGAPAALALSGADEIASAPWPVQLPAGGPLMLLLRSDGWTSPDQHAPLLAGAAPPTVGARVPEAATLRRHAGSTTALRPFVARNSAHRAWGDLISCTPHRPRGLDAEPPLGPADLYTRGTLGLYVTRGRFGQPLTAANAARLRQLLAEFLPINMRAVIVLAPELALEMVYGAGVDLRDSYADDHPFVDALGGPADSWAAALPQWAVLLSNDLVSLSADPVDLTTLRRRSYFPPPT